MPASRRSFCAGSLPALLALAASAREGRADAKEPLQSFVRPFAEMQPHVGAATTMRPVVEGYSAEGTRLEVHETLLNPGAEPHPPHRHKHEEFVLLMKGNLQATIDGKTESLTPGSVAFWKSMSLHGLHNPGPEPAQYFIVAFGGEAQG